MSRHKFKAGDRVITSVSTEYGPTEGAIGTVVLRLLFDKKRPEHALYEVQMDGAFEGDTWPFFPHELEKAK